jgi:2,3-bisphosphoglycerate-independent phosphoglycerate mutase
MINKSLLVILDGWGIGSDPKVDAIRQASTPYMDGLMEHWPNSRLTTFGEEVGLPEGQMGNSEVGHLNIGAGRIVYQELLRINRAIADGSLQREPVVQACFESCKKGSGRLHLLGLLSDGGVHSHISHMIALAKYAEAAGVPEVYIHAFLDGRDTDPNGGAGYLSELDEALRGSSVRLATVIGRYYAMDRDKRWERTKKAYDLLRFGIGEPSNNIIETVKEYYKKGTTDEFMEPIVVDPSGVIREGDSVFFANFRTDRPRQLTEVLTQVDHPDHAMETILLDYTTMTRYDETYERVHVVYDNDNVEMTLGECVSRKGLTQLRAAETEKYPHVTFFFSGGREKPFPGEERILVPSPKVPTYDLQPEMSAPELTDRVMEHIRRSSPDFICLNYANADMVGHTGVFEAAMKAAETVDECVSRLVPLALERGYRVVLIADHGNSDYLINPDGSPNTAHSMNPVPCILVGEGLEKVSVDDGILADVAPTVLKMMGLELPGEMTGRSLF